MADLRLLKAPVLMLLAVAFIAYGLGPIWACRTEGQVVDERTGAPVPGALVFQHYSRRIFRAPNYTYDWRWATTDQDGRFAFPGHFAMIYGLGMFLSVSYRHPDFEVIHPSFGKFIYPYGTGSNSSYDEYWPGFRNLHFELIPIDLDVNDFFKDPQNTFVCGSTDPYRVCARKCQVLWASGDRCKLVHLPRDDSDRRVGMDG